MRENEDRDSQLPWDLDVNEDLRQAAQLLLESRAYPSPAFRDELEEHLRRYAASSFTHRRVTNRKAPPIWLRWLRRGDGPAHWLRLRPLTAGIALVALLIVAFAAITPVGRATARDLARFVGISVGQGTGLPETPTSINLPPQLAEIASQLGFDIRFPTYVPTGLDISGVRRIENEEGLVGLQIDYTHTQDPDVTVLSVKEQGAPLDGRFIRAQGEMVSINGATGILSKPVGPLDLKVLQWSEEGLLIEIATTLSEEELFQVARSLK